jgi:hypothetical protein
VSDERQDEELDSVGNGLAHKEGELDQQMDEHHDLVE